MLNLLLAGIIVVGFALVLVWPTNASRWNENRAAILTAIRSTQPLASSFRIQHEASAILGRRIGTTSLFVHLAGMERSSMIRSAWEVADHRPRRRLYHINLPPDG